MKIENIQIKVHSKFNQYPINKKLYKQYKNNTGNNSENLSNLIAKPW